MRSSTTSTDRLRHEHDVISDVLEGAGTLARRLRRGGEVPPGAIEGALDFFAAFVDRCHDAKEEEALFPLLAGRGVPERTVDTLRVEHDEGRRLIRAIHPHARRGLDGEAVAVLDSYVALLRRHLATEDRSLFPLADRVLTAADETRAQEAFDRIEERAVGAGGRDVLLALGGAVSHTCRAIAALPARQGWELCAQDLVRSKLVAVPPDASLARAAEVMEALRASELPVVDRGALVGLLTRSDMEPHRGHYEWTAVRAAMTADPVAVDPDTPVQSVARLLVERGLTSIPVVSAGKLVGTIASADLLRLLADGDQPGVAWGRLRRSGS